MRQRLGLAGVWGFLSSSSSRDLTTNSTGLTSLVCDLSQRAPHTDCTLWGTCKGTRVKGTSSSSSSILTTQSLKRSTPYPRPPCSSGLAMICCRSPCLTESLQLALVVFSSPSCILATSPLLSSMSQLILVWLLTATPCQFVPIYFRFLMTGPWGL